MEESIPEQSKRKAMENRQLVMDFINEKTPRGQAVLMFRDSNVRQAMLAWKAFDNLELAQKLIKEVEIFDSILLTSFLEIPVYIHVYKEGDSHKVFTTKSGHGSPIDEKVKEKFKDYIGIWASVDNENQITAILVFRFNDLIRLGNNKGYQFPRNKGRVGTIEWRTDMALSTLKWVAQGIFASEFPAEDFYNFVTLEKRNENSQEKA